jgi:putative transposase
MPILVEHAQFLLESIKETNESLYFDIVAWVIMPDHFHLIINPRNNDLSDILKRIKLKYSYKYRHLHDLYRGTLWQNRYWDHVIRDQADMNNHIEYIHYNPVKHGFVKNPFAWPHSSINIYLKEGIYTKDWGVQDTSFGGYDFGE